MIISPSFLTDVFIHVNKNKMNKIVELQNKLNKNKKITKHTLNWVLKNFPNDIYVRVKTSFDGMTDCVEKVNMEVKKVTIENAIGINGVWMVGHSDDYFEKYEDDVYIGLEIWNCCGSGFLMVKK